MSPQCCITRQYDESSLYARRLTVGTHSGTNWNEVRLRTHGTWLPPSRHMELPLPYGSV